MNNFQEKVGFIWSIAELLRGDFKQSEYGRIVLPLTVLRRLDCVLHPSKDRVLARAKTLPKKADDKMKDLIEGWRKTWGNDRLSFYFVQIAPWSGRYEPGQLPALWEGQVASLKIPGTGMAVTTDLVDNIADIHPRNKLDVGNRLALWALAKDYGQKDLVYSGPLYESMKVEGNKIRLSFAHTGGGLKSRDDKPLSEFQIAAAEGAFVPAKAVIDGETVVVEADGVEKPARVQFGWHKVANPNLINAEGLPASPFQTKNWQGGVGMQNAN